MYQKGWRGFELLFLMPLKKQAIKLGDHKHHYQGGQQTQNVRAGDYNPVPGSPQSFIWAHGFNTENFITCTFVLLGVTAVSAFLKTYVRSSKTALLLLYARNNDNIDKLFQAIGWWKLSHQRLVATFVKLWPNGVAGRRKLKTWAYLRLRLARPCVHLRRLAMTCSCLVEIKFARKSKHVFHR